MKRLITLLLLIMVIALSGCGKEVEEEYVEEESTEEYSGTSVKGNSTGTAGGHGGNNVSNQDNKDYDAVNYWKGKEKELLYDGNYRLFYQYPIDNTILNVTVESGADGYHYEYISVGDVIYKFAFDKGYSYVMAPNAKMKWKSDTSDGVKVVLTLDVEDLYTMSFKTSTTDGYDVYSLTLNDGRAAELYVEHATKRVSHMLSGNVIAYIDALSARSFNSKDVKNASTVTESDGINAVSTYMKSLLNLNTSTDFSVNPDSIESFGTKH